MKFLIDAHLPPGLRAVFQAAVMMRFTRWTCRTRMLPAMVC